MSKYSTVARPYAKAVFQVAEASNTFDLWSIMLKNWGQVAKDKRVKKLFNDPKVKFNQLINFMSSFQELNEHGRRFISILAHAKRLEILPEIARIYEELYAERSGSLKVEVLVSKPLNKDQTERIRKALSVRLDRKIDIQETIDESLIAGVKVKVNDTVWDASLRGRLTRLAENLIGF